mmetsp:Transcript_14301/g.12615  ORF Transcript_14301/g.12615 Transcript_14301/m.12615 type:complete len:139 (-) Transcript_14301:35-451(-)
MKKGTIRYHQYLSTSPFNVIKSNVQNKSESSEEETGKLRKQVNISQPRALSVPIDLDINYSSQGNSQIRFQERIEPTPSQERLMQDCLKEISQKVKKRNVVNLKESYYSMRNPKSSWKMHKGDKRWLKDIVVQKYRKS